MKLVTFNIRCDYEQDGLNNFSNRKPLILEKIKKESPDIICFQEVLPHVAIWLKENLTDYYVIGCGRSEQLEDEQTTIAYKLQKLNLLSMQVFWLSETPLIPASRYPDQSICPRICTEALFQNLETKEIFRVYNTHLDHIGEESRKRSLLQLMDRITRQEGILSAPAIIAGDFNALPDSPELDLLYHDPNLKDLTVQIGATFHDYGQLTEPEKIDYIFADQSFACSRVDVWRDCHQGVYLSDHYPVCVEIYTK